MQYLKWLEYSCQTQVDVISLGALVPVHLYTLRCTYRPGTC